MADVHTPGKLEAADTALDRLEAALELIARGLQAQAQPGVPPAGADVLNEVEQRLDAAIDHAKAALGRKSDQ